MEGAEMSETSSWQGSAVHGEAGTLPELTLGWLSRLQGSAWLPRPASLSLPVAPALAVSPIQTLNGQDLAVMCFISFSYQKGARASRLGPSF